MVIGSQSAAFDVELTVTAPFTGVAQLLGILTNTPAILLVSNDSDTTAFFADNSGTTNGTTMVAGKQMVLDLNTNRYGTTDALTFNKGTKFYVTGSGGTGAFRVGVIYAKGST